LKKTRAGCRVFHEIGALVDEAGLFDSNRNTERRLNMKPNRSMIMRLALLVSLMANLAILSSRIQADTGNCGAVNVTLPFTDVQGNPFFCLIAQAYFS
jgi:hypothetical protein